MHICKFLRLNPKAPDKSNHNFKVMEQAGRAEPLTDKGGEETGVPEKTPDDELQKMPHTKAGQFRPQTRFEPAV